MAALETIEPITDPLGKHWQQPDHSKWLIDDKYVIMTAEDSKKLLTYNTSLPSGVYPGKCWARQVNSILYLCWYSTHPDPNKVYTNSRQIILL